MAAVIRVGRCSAVGVVGVNDTANCCQHLPILQGWATRGGINIDWDHVRDPAPEGVPLAKLCRVSVMDHVPVDPLIMQPSSASHVSCSTCQNGFADRKDISGRKLQPDLFIAGLTQHEGPPRS